MKLPTLHKAIDSIADCAPSQIIRKAPEKLAAYTQSKLQGTTYRAALSNTNTASSSFVGAPRNNVLKSVAQGAVNGHSFFTTKVLAASAWGVANIATAPGKFNLPVPHLVSKSPYLANVVWPASAPLVAWMAAAEAAVYATTRMFHSDKVKNSVALTVLAGVVMGAALVFAEPYRLATSCVWATIEGASLAVGAACGLLGHIWGAMRGPVQAPTEDELEDELDAIDETAKNLTETVKDAGAKTADKGKQVAGEVAGATAKGLNKAANAIDQKREETRAPDAPKTAAPTVPSVTLGAEIPKK